MSVNDFSPEGIERTRAFGLSPETEPWVSYTELFGSDWFSEEQCIGHCEREDRWTEGVHYRVYGDCLQIRMESMGYQLHPDFFEQGRLDLSNKTTALYRHFDEDGDLLYVGISLNPIRRLQQHANSEWFDQITRIEIERFSTRAEALEAERKAIKSERPFFNEKHNLAGDDDEVEG